MRGPTSVSERKTLIEFHTTEILQPIKLNQPFYALKRLLVPNRGSFHGSEDLFYLLTEKPYMVKHPEDKVRYEGQRVLLCCKATGSPAPDKYYW